MRRQTAAQHLTILLALSLGCDHRKTSVTPPTPEWHKHAANPVLTPGPPGSWDALGVGSPSVLREAPNSYRMWYSGRDSTGGRIGLATSSDGVTWTKHPGNPVMDRGATGAWDASNIGDPNVVFDGTNYRMYYAGNRGASSTSIGVAISSDGTSWIRSEHNPVLTTSSTSWESAEVRFPSVVMEQSNYTMWYSSAGAIGLATSGDGFLWTKLPSPVLNPQAIEAIVGAPSVFETGGGFRMWFIAQHERPGGGFLPGVVDDASSADGIEWTWKRGVLEPGPAGAWDDGALGSVCVILTNNGLRMWYGALSVQDQSGIGYATFE